MHPIDKERVDELCQELRPFLDAELAAGNRVVDTSRGWPCDKSLYIMLAAPFLAQHWPVDLDNEV